MTCILVAVKFSFSFIFTSLETLKSPYLALLTPALSQLSYKTHGGFKVLSNFCLVKQLNWYSFQNGPKILI